jgi:antitoxin component YwqK of YwqJK toxin-antitoxin module
MRTFTTLILLLFAIVLKSQNYELKGYVVDINDIPIAFASVYFQSNDEVLGTMTDTTGYFEIKNIPYEIIELKASFMGYSQYKDTIILSKTDSIIIILKDYNQENPNRYLVTENDTIYYYYYSFHNGWVTKSIDGPAQKMCNGEPCNGLVSTYYISGQLEEKGHFKNGYLDSCEYTSYYENGTIDFQGKIENNRRVGQWKFYDENGNINCLVSYNIHGGEISEVCFGENGIIEDFERYDPESQSYQAIYFNNGFLDELIIKTNNLDDGKSIKFNLDGEIIE